MSSPATTLPATPVITTPTRVRYSVLGWACSLSLLTYLDRVCMKEVQAPMREELGLTATQISWAMAAFFFAYSIFEVPTGWLGDRLGPRKVLFRIVVWWSAFTVLTGLVWPFQVEVGGVVVFSGFALLLLVRFLFGVGEAGAYPNASKLLKNWFPYERRGTTQGLLWAFARWGGGLAPVLIASLPFGWRGVFYSFGVIGTIWAIFFWWKLRDTPRQDPHVNEAELCLIEGGQPHGASPRPPISWSAMLRSPTLWWLSLMYFFSNAGWCFFITWDKEYFVKVLDLSGPWLTVASSAPLVCGGIACLLGGAITDALVRVLGRRWGRSAQGLVAYTVGGSFFLAALAARHPLWSVVLLCLASFAKDFAMGVSWATSCDIGHRYSGSVAGFMNMVGNCGSVVATPVVAYLATNPVAEPWSAAQTLSAGFANSLGGAVASPVIARWGADQMASGWSVALVVSAVSLYCAAFGWLLIDPRHVIVYTPDDHRRLHEQGAL